MFIAVIKFSNLCTHFVQRGPMELGSLSVSKQGRERLLGSGMIKDPVFQLPSLATHSVISLSFLRQNVVFHVFAASNLILVTNVMFLLRVST